MTSIYNVHVLIRGNAPEDDIIKDIELQVMDFETIWGFLIKFRNRLPSLNIVEHPDKATIILSVNSEDGARIEGDQWTYIKEYFLNELHHPTVFAHVTDYMAHKTPPTMKIPEPLLQYVYNLIENRPDWVWDLTGKWTKAHGDNKSSTGDGSRHNPVYSMNTQVANENKAYYLEINTNNTRIWHFWVPKIWRKGEAPTSDECMEALKFQMKITD